MFLELIAAVAAAFAGAGIGMALVFISGKRLPRWIIPVSAGAMMLGYAIWSEYTWYDRTRASLPDDGLVVTATESGSAFFRPWTYVAPMVSGFAMVDLASIRTNPAVPDTRIANMLAFGRWKAPRDETWIFDCAEARRAPLISADIAEDGVITKADWTPPIPEDTAIQAICSEEIVG